MDSRIEFLYRSIEDAQNAIRAIDVKLTTLLVIVLIPIAHVTRIAVANKALATSCPATIVLSAAFIVSWLCAFYFIAIGLLAISNPAKNVAGEAPPGAFYGGGYFSWGTRDAFWNCNLKSGYTIENAISELPVDDAALIKELVFEKMKTAYIRGIKIHRSQYAVRSVMSFMLTGGAIWVLHLAL